MRQRILVVDDEPETREVLRLMLSFEGYEVTEASNGEEAVSSAIALRPDLIFMDWMMPELDGPGAVARLREDARTNGIPVIMLTANQQSSAVGHALLEGAVCYVTKPFDTEVVALVAKKFIHSSNP